jgi:DNA gyrase/topoisomerase IV subunit B
VWGESPATVLGMGKLTNLLASIGLVPGQKANREKLRFESLTLATDADHDGDDIFTTLICLFHSFWPELFDPKQKPFVYRLISPNIIAVKGKQRIHFSSMDKFEEKRNQMKSYSISYIKGLGSLETEDWEMIINNSDPDILIPILDDGLIGTTLELLFGPNSTPRKTWLMGESVE